MHVIRGMDHECDGFLFATTYTPHATHLYHSLRTHPGKDLHRAFYRIGGSVSISGAPALTLNVGNISGADLMVGTGLPKPMLL